MPSGILCIPHEIYLLIIEGLSIDDVISLGSACKKLRDIQYGEQFCRTVLEKKVPFSKEAIAAKQDGSYTRSFRQLTKRRQAVAEARPFGITILGIADSYLYCRGILSYCLDGSLRVLDLLKSPYQEFVIDTQALLLEAIPHVPYKESSFRVLYSNEDIISCLYKFTAPATKWLIVFNYRKRQLLLEHELHSSKKIFVRHDSKYLYYGTHSEYDPDGHLIWVVTGYKFGPEIEKGEWFPYKVNLWGLVGSDIGRTVSFRIYDGYFYALSNQTTNDVEEVDWTSLYRCMRFPIDSPNPLLLSQMDEKSLWRRQHSEGVIDDQWTTLRMAVNEETGSLQIIESRMEWLPNSSEQKRTFYLKDITFKEHTFEEIMAQHSAPESKFSPLVNSLLPASTIQASSSPNLMLSLTNSQLAALTNDPLALTLSTYNNPHYLPPQTRLPRDVHRCNTETFLFSRVCLSYYNASANTYIDLVNDASPASYPQPQKLRIRSGARKLCPPSSDNRSLLLQESLDPLTGQVLSGLNEAFTSNTSKFWPPKEALSLLTEAEDADVTSLMNPTNQPGTVEATADDTSFIYLTGQKGQPRALVFVDFDPTAKINGLRRWRPSTEAEKMKVADGRCRGATHDSILGNENASWIRVEEPMYRAVNRGYDFSS